MSDIIINKMTAWLKWFEQHFNQDKLPYGLPWCAMLWGSKALQISGVIWSDPKSPLGTRIIYVVVTSFFSLFSSANVGHEHGRLWAFNETLQQQQINQYMPSEHFDKLSSTFHYMNLYISVHLLNVNEIFSYYHQLCNSALQHGIFLISLSNLGHDRSLCPTKIAGWLIRTSCVLVWVTW